MDPDDVTIFQTAFINSERELKEIITILNPPNGVYTVHINPEGVDPDSTFTLTVAAQSYDTIATDVRFADVPTKGYSTDVDVNQMPIAVMGMLNEQGTLVPIADTVSIGVGSVVTLAPQPSYDPDGDDLLDFSVDFYADNEWEIYRLTNFSQQVLWSYDTIGVYPIVLRVRDQYQLSGLIN
jgi:hypothetical protein